MPRTCCIYNCKNRGGNQNNISFFRFPLVREKSQSLFYLSKKRQDFWLKLINRKDIKSESYKHTSICSNHFISGRSAKLSDYMNPDWIPTLNLGYSKERAKRIIKLVEYSRNKIICAKQEDLRKTSENNTEECEMMDDQDTTIKVEVVYFDEVEMGKDELSNSSSTDEQINAAPISSTIYDTEKSAEDLYIPKLMVLTKWNEAQSKRLLDLYISNLNNIGKDKKFPNKRYLYTYIAELLNREFKLELTYTQVESRYKSILKKRRKTELKDLQNRQKLTSYPQIISSNTLSYPKTTTENPKESLSSQISSEQMTDKDTDSSLIEPPTQRMFRNLSPKVETKDLKAKMFNMYLEYKRERHRDTMKFLKQMEEDKKMREVKKQRRHDEKMDILRDLRLALLQRL